MLTVMKTPSPDEMLTFIRDVALLTREGETFGLHVEADSGEIVQVPRDDEFVMENDDAFETLDGCIADARSLLGLSLKYED